MKKGILNEFIEKLCTDEVFAKKVYVAKDKKEIEVLSKEVGLDMGPNEISEMQEILNNFNKMEKQGMLSDDELEGVVGGRSNVKITYINRSMNKDLPKIFTFTKNEIPTFDALKEGVAWKVIENVGRECSSNLVFPIETGVKTNE